MKRSRRTLAGSPRRNGAGSGPPVVATTSTSSPARARVVTSRSRPRSALSSVPWVTCTTGPAAVELVPPRRLLDGAAGGARIGPTNRTDGRRGPSAGTRSRPPSPAGRRRPPWAGGRRSSRGIRRSLPASASRRRAKRCMSASTTCSVAQFMVALRSPVQRSRSRAGTPPRTGAVSRLFDAVRHDADTGQRRPGRPRAQCEGEGAEEHGVDHDAVGGEAVEDGAQVPALAGQRADEDPAQVVLHAPHARAWTTTRVRGWPPSDRGRRPRRRRGRSGRPSPRPGAVVLGREEDDVVPVGDEAAGHGQQWCGVARGRVSCTARSAAAARSSASRRRHPRAGAPARRRRSTPPARARCSRSPSRRRRRRPPSRPPC